ncbi:uncharacterized protein [Apostichopus japonicus]|uniref:uncharacterized protein isoform X2 n=1 Tax=Stichopus japonicus TaxID=307972 RepID=UPI003AB782DE
MDVVLLKYRPEKEDAGEINYTTHNRSVREEEACDYTAARFSVSSSSGSGYYHCAWGEEKSLEVFVNVQQNTSSVSCFSRSFSETNEACVTCLSGNDSTLFRETRTERTDQRLNCNATTDGGVSCNFLLPLRGQQIDDKTIRINVLPVPYSYNLYCNSPGRDADPELESTEDIKWVIEKSESSVIVCTVKTPWGHASEAIRFEVKDYSNILMCLTIYVAFSACLLLLALFFCSKKQCRIWKLRHIYATFSPSLSEGGDTPHRDLSRRPTRSLPPIPGTRMTHEDDLHYANAHLRLSQSSMPARFRHSMFSVSSDVSEAHFNKRSSLPLHASNVSAQNALYFFTDPAYDMSPKETVLPKTQAFTFPYLSKGGDSKHHTLNNRTSSVLGKRRASDYQNWFQRYKLSTSCPAIDIIEEGKEQIDQLKSMVPIRNRVDRRKRRSLIRHRLSSSSKHQDQTLPRRKLPSLSRPLSEYMMQPENPYVKRDSTVSSCYSK